MKGKNDSTPFLPLKSKTGGKVTYVQNKDDICLTERQADHVYKAVEKGNMINTKTMTSEMAQNQEDNLYKRVVLNNVYKMPESCPEMKNWSIFSDNVRYVQHDQITAQDLDLDTLDYRNHQDLYFQLKDEEIETLDIDFGLYPDVTRARYLDVYEDVYAEMVSASKFDENSDLSTTYLGQTNMTRNTKIKAEERFPITGQGFASGKLSDGTECQILLDTGATKSYMSKSYYLRCKTLHALPKFSSNTQRIQVGNGQYVSVLFVIPVIIDIHGHRFEIFTLVSEIHDNVDLVMGMKNIFELEGVIDSRESCFSFLSRSIPFFPMTTVEIAPASQKIVMVDAPFVEELSGMAMIKILDMKTQTTNMIKLKFIRNRAVLKIKNNTHETVTYGKTNMMGIVDLRSLGFYKIKQEVLQEHLSRHYHFELADDVCDQYNRLVNLMRKEEEKSEGKFPWLDDTDDRKHMTDREILDKYINLDNSCLTKAEKEQVRDLLYQYKDAFSLRDEIGLCPNIEIEIDVTDKSPFFIRPFHANEDDKVILDKEMKRLCYLGILKEGFSAYSSPVMLISRKMTKDKRVVTDFRHLNMQIAKNNLAYPLLKDTFSMLGSSKCEVMSVLDLKDAFHSLRLTENSKKFCGILPYFGSPSYLYQRMPMGLNISPPIWQSYINAILNCLQSRKYCEAIMDDLLLFTPTKASHFEKLEDLLKALCKNGLKISPKKCQLFKTDLQYMGNTIFIRNKRVCVRPLRSRIEAIQKLEPPTTIKGCRSFAGMVNFVSLFCPELQKLLKPIYDLTRKGRQFLWGKEQQQAFDEIKRRLQRPPVLHLPDRHGRFQLYSDTSKFATGSALYQVQNGQPRLIAYASKRMPEAARNYSITELEMCGLAMNIATFAHLLKKVDFDAIVDHLAITHIMRSKAEPATTRIKRLLELLSPYSFNLYYIKGKDMVLSDFLSRQKTDDSNPHELIPISFSLRDQVSDYFYRIDNESNLPRKDKYLVQTRSQVRASGIRVPEIHGANKGLDPHVQPGKQKSFPIQTVNKGMPTHPIPKPRIGQGRAGLRRKAKAPLPIASPHLLPVQPITEHDSRTAMPLPEPTNQSQSHVQSQIWPRQPSQHHPIDPAQIPQQIGPKIQHRPTPSYPDPYARPPPKPPDISDPLNSRKDLLDNDSDRKLEIEENLPFQEGIISEIYERPDNSYVQEPQELTDLIDTSKLIQKYLPKQMDIDKILDIIKRKVLKGTHLLLAVKEIQAGYLTSPYFKDLYLFLSQNKLPSKRSAIKKVEMLAESFVLLDSLLFKLVTTPDKEAAVLAIPEICVDKIIALYHTSLFAGHQGVVKMYLTMKDKFFIPNLMHYLRSFIKGCHVCQLSRSDKPPTRQLQPRIYLNYRPLSKLSMDLKVMPRSQKGHKFILCIIDEMTNYLVTVPIFDQGQKR